jgi:hypothetical protein
MRAHLKGLSAPAPVAYSLIRPKSHISNIKHDGTLSFRNFIMMVENFEHHNFEALCYTLAYGHDPAKDSIIQKRVWWHSNDWKFHTDDKKIKFYFFSCPVTDQQPKNVLPYFRGNTEFPIFLFLENLFSIIIQTCAKNQTYSQQVDDQNEYI